MTGGSVVDVVVVVVVVSGVTLDSGESMVIRVAPATRVARAIPMSTGFLRKGRLLFSAIRPVVRRMNNTFTLPELVRKRHIRRVRTLGRGVSRA